VLPKPIDVVLHGNKRILDNKSNQFRHQSDLNSILASRMTAIFGRDSRIMLFFISLLTLGETRPNTLIKIGAHGLPWLKLKYFQRFPIRKKPKQPRHLHLKQKFN